MKNAKSGVTFLVSPILLALLILPAVSLLPNSILIKSSGTIGLAPHYTGEPALPLHTDGKYIEYPNGTAMLLRGVWTGMFADTSTGWWSTDASTWDEGALNYTLDLLRIQWGVNVINTFFWAEWWNGNWNATLMGGNNQTNIGERDALIRTAQVCQAYGMYFQIRLMGMNGLPINTPFDYQDDLNYSELQFVNFWKQVSANFTQAGLHNMIYEFYDEPTGNETLWFNVCNQTIAAIRANGDNNLILIDWDYCGSVSWITDWINEGYPTTNIFFDEHIYRSLGTFAYDPNYPTDYDSIFNFLNNPNLGDGYTGTATFYEMNTYNVPVWVGAVGANYGDTNDQEYVAFYNTIWALQQNDVGYAVFSCTRTGSQAFIQTDPMDQVFAPPNRVGQALIDAIAGIAPPPTYQLNITTNNDPTSCWVNGTLEQTPYSSTIFSGVYNVTVPSTVTDYTDHVLVGNTAGEGAAIGSGYSDYVYSCSPCRINQSVTASSMYVYSCGTTNAQVAIYNVTYDLTGTINPHYYKATNLIVANNSLTPCTRGWNLVTFASTTLAPGNYSLSVHFTDSGMNAGSPPTDWAGMNWSWNDTSNTFDSNVTNISDTAGDNIAVYIPNGTLVTTLYHFLHWKDGSTNPVRTINLTTNMTLTATYQTTT